MKASEQTLLQIERALRKTLEKYPIGSESFQLTDIHVRLTQETGELMTFDDDNQELTRCVVEQWIDNKDDDFYDQAAVDIRQVLMKHKEQIDNLPILKPFSFVLEDDDHDLQTELYVVDDDMVMIDPELMKNLDEDLDSFFDQLMKS